MSLFEIRTATQAIEQRGTSNKRKLVGHAAVFDSPALIGGQFTEQIARGAFTQSIIKNDIRALFNHDAACVLGRVSAGTLKLSQDNVGLRVEIDIPDTALARDLAVLVERGDISGMSFGFRVVDEDWNDEVWPPLRVIREIDLFEVSVVTFPAYESTDVALRVAAFSAAAVVARVRMIKGMRARGIAA